MIQIKSGICISLLAAVLMFTGTAGRAGTTGEESPDPALAAHAMHAVRDKIIVGGDNYYPPYEFLDKNGRPTGFNVELTRAIADVMGVSVEIRLGVWSEMRAALEAGTVDVLQGMVYSKERSRKYSFSPPHSIVRQSVFSRRDAPPLGSIRDLEGREIIVQNKGMMYDYLKARRIECTLIEKATHAQALRLLASGRHDYAVVANLPGLYMSREFGLSNLVRVAEPIMAGPYGYVVQKDNLELLSLFGEGLSILKNTGRYDALKNKWLSPLEPSRSSLKRILKYGSIVILPLLMVLAGVAAWNHMLQRKVARATADLKKEIQERRKAAEEAEVRQQQLIQADKMATLGTLVSGVAHEINNPTGLILLNLPVLKKTFDVVQESLEDRYESSGDFMVGGMKFSTLREQIPSMLDETLSSAKRIKRIVSDLKDFARMESSDINTEVDVNRIVETSARLLASTIQKSTRNFTLSCDPGIPLVPGNAQRLEQVVINLIANACQSLESKQDAVSVSTRYERRLETVCIQVSDQGIGIDTHQMPHILDPFFTTKRNNGGTGLGLSIASGIVKDHGGRLDFRSAPGKGTCVTLRLPQTKQENENDGYPDPLL
ncbi:MAG: transporter substrate-binding domain-containing protein [Desulfobacter sp.]